MILTRLALTNTRVTWLLLGVIVIAGLQAFKNMPRAYDPGFIIRAAQVGDRTSPVRQQSG
jgi:multidrug efflux pump subunit AcrB